MDGVLKEKEFLHQLDLPNADERKGLYVIKNTMATGVMIGCAMELLSVVQENHAYYGVKTSMEIAVHPYNHEDGGGWLAQQSYAPMDSRKGVPPPSWSITGSGSSPRFEHGQG